MSEYNYSEYQYVFEGGKLTTVANMTEEQLRAALCEAMDLIENIESAADRVNRIIENWRR